MNGGLLSGRIKRKEDGVDMVVPYLAADGNQGNWGPNQGQTAKTNTGLRVTKTQNERKLVCLVKDQNSRKGW